MTSTVGIIWDGTAIIGMESWVRFCRRQYKLCTDYVQPILWWLRIDDGVLSKGTNDTMVYAK
eukprot:scaffold4885_cov50-Attheya_sp.AAC.3